uniref:Uncharacterized protein n=1 Tax=Trieres chinensis TaxID=1514140 RepID=A0A7S1Z2J1_TRICV|mmetsp:Transcript_16315/g.33483  ORF Transcript_16315/g.33483 Transcript_16315/m.33483 type:complete len:628 (+) Transcript_16315:134-2017(+)
MFSLPMKSDLESPSLFAQRSSREFTNMVKRKAFRRVWVEHADRRGTNLGKNSVTAGSPSFNRHQYDSRGNYFHGTKVILMALCLMMIPQSAMKGCRNQLVLGLVSKRPFTTPTKYKKSITLKDPAKNKYALSKSRKNPPEKNQLSHDPSEANKPQEKFLSTFLPSLMQNTTTLEMTMMSAIGFTISSGVLVTLAMNSEVGQSSTQIESLREMVSSAGGDDLVGAAGIIATDGLGIVEEGVEELEVITRTIVSTLVPQSATDVFAVALGEGIAGVIGAISTWGIGLLLRLRTDANAAAVAATNAVDEAMKIGVGQTFGSNLLTRASQPNVGGNKMFDGLLSEAIADGDYFLTRAAAIPLLESVGIPRFAATLASVALATIPYELIKITNQQRKMREEEDRLFDELLGKQKKEEAKRLPWLANGRRKDKKMKSFLPTETISLDVTSSPGNWTTISSPANEVDFVQIFADVTKWLEYDVLTNDFSGVLTFRGQVLDSGVESAVFGFLAVMSSQLYADNLYLYSDYGTKEATNEARNRKPETWASLYSTKCLNGAALFGVYETVRLPISKFIQTLLTGGVDGCIGSGDYELCVETYLVDNPTGESVEAEFRALFAAFVSVITRFLPDGIGS